MPADAPPLPTKPSEMTTNDDLFRPDHEEFQVKSISFSVSAAKNDDFMTTQ